MTRNEIILLFIIILLIYCKNNKDYEYFNVYSSLDKRKYNVVGRFANYKDAADKMAESNKFIIELLRFLRNKFLIKKQGDILEQNFVSRLLNRYNPDVLLENWPKPGDDTSFVINKGDKFGLCLRDKKYNEFHENNILQFVIIHELTHMGTTTYGHNYEFWSWMKFMLVQAKESGLYTPVNYGIHPEKYCGLKVSSNPYFQNYNWLLPR